MIYKTIDGGVSWYITELLLLNNLYSVYFTDNTTGYIAGNGVCKTMDGGETWLPVPVQMVVLIQFAFQMLLTDMQLEVIR
ncbi:MAG: hypothetical protein IPH84_13720 [Bacteroidales bacterium]|nr:hypothetical protein [Bacteroidales bacterium]